MFLIAAALVALFLAMVFPSILIIGAFVLLLVVTNFLTSGSPYIILQFLGANVFRPILYYSLAFWIYVMREAEDGLYYLFI